MVCVAAVAALLAGLLPASEGLASEAFEAAGLQPAVEGLYERSFASSLEEAPCADVVGTCVVFKSCPEGASCRGQRCVCNVGSCGDGGLGPILGKCVPAKRSGRASQPLLDPSSWFLTGEEILHGRHGHPRGQEGNIANFSRGNLVRPFLEGGEFFRDLYDSLEAAGPGDQFLAAGWLVGPYFQLRPELDINGEANSTFGAVMTRLCQREVETLGLFWRNVKPSMSFASLKEEQSLIDVVRQCAASKAPNSSRVEVYLDARCDMLGSIHQKFFVLTRKDSRYPRAWVGGIDVAQDRWDVVGSNTTFPVATDEGARERQQRTHELRQRQAGLAPVLRNECPGWHDTEFAIDGPAAVDLAATYAERWNEPSCHLTDLEPETRPPPVPIANPPPASRDGPPVGTSAVQTLRTYSCTYAKGSSCYNGFAPAGETSASDGLLKAIRTARFYIYIEDQYFYWVEEVYDALRAALRDRISHLILLVQMPQEVPGASTWVWRLWQPLFQEFPDKVHAFYRTGDVYIHSKTKVFDDVWTMSGSPNLNYRSMTADAEAAVAVVDEGPSVVTPEGFKVSAFARRFRCGLFEDNTGVPAPDCEAWSLDEAVKKLHEIAVTNQSRIAAFRFDWAAPDDQNVPQYAYWSDVDALRKTADPDGRCPQSEPRAGLVGAFAEPLASDIVI